jgi:hypothetical protein
MKINIGAGSNHYEGFLNCDYDPLSNADYIFDLEHDRYPFEDNTIEAVIAHHVLEHMGEGFFHCMKEVYRICKHGATVDIRTPHHRHDHFLIDPTHRRAITVDGLKLFSKKYNQHCREKEYAASRLGEQFNVDFEVIDFDYIPTDFYRKHLEGKPIEEVELYIRERNNIILETQMKLTVIKEYV